MMSALRRARNKAADRYPWATATLVTIAGRVRSREQWKLRIFYDGQDWIHTWGYGVFVSDGPRIFPHRATSQNLSLFTEHFTPGKGQTVVDVGAGVGTEVWAFSRLVGETGRVICIEADPVACRYLSKTVKVAGLSNVVIINKAVSSSEGSVRLSQNPSSVSNSIVVGSNDGLFVHATTLDCLLDDLQVDKVDYLKMNIEGAEVAALEGFETGPYRVRNWCVSCHDFKRGPEFATFDRVKIWMQGHGLTVWQHERNDVRPWEGFYLYARARTS